MAEQTAVAPLTEETKALAVESNLLDLFAEDAGGGMEGMGAGDFAIPFIAILQKGSPQVSRANPKYIKGADQGMIFNTVTQDMFAGEEGFEAIPCGYTKQIVRWKPRDSGGGLVGVVDPNSPILAKCTKNEKKQLVDADSGDVFIDTALHYILFLHPDSFPEFAVISMSSSQLKTSRVWNTTMRRIMVPNPVTKVMFNPPTYSRIYRVTTIGQVRDQFDWYGWKVDLSRDVTDAGIYKLAKSFSKEINSGRVKIGTPPQDNESEDVEGSGVDPEGVPF